MKLIVLICMSFVLAFVSARNPRCYRTVAYGNCRGFHSMWSYSQIQKKCFQFDYSGCGGTDNRFYTETDCLRTCFEITTTTARTTTLDPPDINKEEPDYPY